ncbi:MAG: polysaccharide deacetylase family protein [Treponema sp.]|jgi:peptidoglycan/xylan/chitin deacetylase (PgdA/CDA1 family)|nr:polysaccharide deacetylase family protein [Treponema sp.]
MKKALYGVFFVILAIGCEPDNRSETAVSITNIEGVTIPKTGATPVRTITASSQFTGNVAWTPPDHTVFLASTQYTASITLTPIKGYTLEGISSEDFFSVEGATTTYNAETMVVKAVFPATGSELNTGTDKTISVSNIQGVPAPKTGATPVKAITASSQFTGTVEWTPDHTVFLTSTQYTASITLTPIKGYTLQGVNANFFKVNGAETTNSAGTGVVTAKFPDVTPDKWIAFTFDDVPSGVTTTQLLDVLKTHNIKATFFVIGNKIGQGTNKQIMQRIKDEGHEFGNHSWAHDSLGAIANKETIRKNLQDTQNAINETTGITPALFRDPNLSWSATVAEVLTEMGLPRILFNVDPQDWDGNKTADQISATVRNGAKDGGIVLMHNFDGNTKTINALPEIIADLKEKGYGFVTVSELARKKNKTLEAGKQYSSF